MATNPLQVPVMGGSLDTPVAGVGVATPMLSGPSVVPNRTISDIMSTISGIAQATTGVLQEEIRLKNISKQDKEQIEINEFALLQKEANLWKAQTELHGPEIVNADLDYQTFLVKLDKENKNTERSPVFQAKAAELLQSQFGYLNSEKRTLESDKERQEYRARQLQEDNERKKSRAGNELADNVIQELNLDIAKGIPAEQAEAKYLGMYGDIPEVEARLKKENIQRQIRALSDMAKAAEEEIKDEFTNGSRSLNTLSITVSDPLLEDPVLYDKALSNTVKAVKELYITSGDKDLGSLSAIMQSQKAVEEEFARISNPNALQSNYMNSVRAAFVEQNAAYIESMEGSVKNLAKAGIASYDRKGMDINPDSVNDIIVNAYNKQLGINAISYGNEGFTSAIPGLDEVIVSASNAKEELLAEWERDAPKREATKRLQSNTILSEDDFKTAEFDPETATLSEVDAYSKKVNKGSDLGVFQSTVVGFLTNPRRPDGTLDVERMQKAATIVDNMDVSRSILLDGNNVVNEDISRKIVRLEVWSSLSKNPEALGDTKFRNMFGPIVGTDRFSDNLANAERFIFGADNLAGTDKENALEPDTKGIAKLHKGLAISGPTMKILQYFDRMYRMDHGSDPDDQIRKEYHKQGLKMAGISLIDNGRGNIYPIADEYGHAPSEPIKSLKSALDIIPDPGSPLHTSILATFSLGKATGWTVDETKGMTIRELISKYSKKPLEDSEINITSAAKIPNGPVDLPKNAKSFSDFTWNQLFGHGVIAVRIPKDDAGFDQMSGMFDIKINSTLERLLNDPNFGIQEKKNAKAEKFRKSKTWTDSINEVIDLINQTPGANQKLKDKQAEKMKQ